MKKPNEWGKLPWSSRVKGWLEAFPYLLLCIVFVIVIILWIFHALTGGCREPGKKTYPAEYDHPPRERELPR